MFRWIHYDAHVSRPHDQVARLRRTHPQKVRRSAVKVRRTGVGIRMARPFIQGVHEVRTIRRKPLFVVRPGQFVDDGPAFLRAEGTETRPCGRSRLCLARSRLRLCRSIDRQLWNWGWGFC